MNPLIATRALLCGIIAGAIYALLSTFLVAVWGNEFLVAVDSVARAANRTVATGAGLFVATVVPGIWAMALYAFLHRRLPSRAAVVVVVALAWWSLASAQSLKWMLLLGVPAAAALPLVGNLVPTLIAVAIGSILFGAGARGRAPRSATTGPA